MYIDVITSQSSDVLAHSVLIVVDNTILEGRVLAIIVCLSVTRQYCIKTAKRRITPTTPRDSPGTLVF